MQASTLAIYQGANIHTPFPAIRLLVDLGVFADRPTGRLGPAFNERLMALLPGLAGLPLDEGSDLTFPRALTEDGGLSLARVIAHVAVALQRAAAVDVSYATSVPAEGPGEEYAIFAYEEAETGVRAVQLARDVVARLLPDDLWPPELPRAKVEFPRQFDEFVSYARNHALDISTRELVRTAERRGIPWFRTSTMHRFVQLGHGKHQKRLHETVTGSTSYIAFYYARSKALMGKVMVEHGLPVAPQATVRTAQSAQTVAERIGFPVVVKPNGGGKGQGVTVGITDKDAVAAAFEKARRYDGNVLVEAFVEGRDHRMLVIDGEVVAVAQRVPGHVIGDGERSVVQLVDELNRDPRRGRGYSTVLQHLVLDDEADRMLALQGLGRDSVPPKNAVVPLRATANISTGGTAVDMTEQVHPDNRQMAIDAVRACGLDVAGLDYLTTDISRSFREVGGAISEINASPGLRPHWIAGGAAGAAVNDRVIDLVFPPGAPCRIPTVAVTGTNGKTTTSRMVARILKHAGYTVGMTTTDGVYVDERQTIKGDHAGAGGARAVLCDGRVDAAVLETARGGILRRGILMDRVDVGAVLNLADDHVGQLGMATLQDLAKAKRLVVELATEAAVLNADDPLCVDMAPAVSAKAICYVTTDPKNALVREHTKAGGTAAILKPVKGRPVISLKHGRKATTVLSADEVPATLEGVAPYNGVNALYAAAIADCMGVAVAHIRSGLASFGCGYEDTPGRLNIREGPPFRVILDFGHNQPGLELVCETIRRIAPDRRSVCLLSAPGTKLDDNLRDMARAVADTFESFVCSNWVRNFTREPDVVPNILRDALVACGVPAERVAAVPDLTAAVDTALGLAGTGDTVTIFADDHDAIWRQINDFQPA